MNQDNQPNDVHKISDEDRFYILMVPLSELVDPHDSTALNQCETEDELRQAIVDRAAKVNAILRRNDVN